MFDQLTQPQATVAAASIAVAAALIAWSGVRMQIKAEDQRRRRADQVDALTAAYAAAYNLVRTWAVTRAAEGREVADDYAKAYVQMLSATGRLVALGGFDSAVATMKVLSDKTTELSSSPPAGHAARVSESNSLGDVLKAVEDAITAAVKSVVGN